MAKLSAGFKKRELIPEGSYNFMIEEEPKEVTLKKKTGEEFHMIEFKLRDIEKNQNFTKGFFPNSVGDLLLALGVSIDEDKNFETTDCVGKYFKCDVKHIYLNNGNQTDNFINLQPSKETVWDS